MTSCIDHLTWLATCWLSSQAVVWFVVIICIRSDIYISHIWITIKTPSYISITKIGGKRYHMTFVFNELKINPPRGECGMYLCWEFFQLLRGRKGNSTLSRFTWHRHFAYDNTIHQVNIWSPPRSHFICLLQLNKNVAILYEEDDKTCGQEFQSRSIMDVSNVPLYLYY